MDQFTSAIEDEEVLWHGVRIMREDRRVMEIVAITQKYLASCAKDNQAIIVDSCNLRKSAIAVCLGATRISSEAIAWTVAVGVESYRAIRRATKLPEVTRNAAGEFQTYDVHPLFQHPEQWSEAGIKVLLTDLTTLGESRTRNPLNNDNVLQLKTSHISIVDPHLELGCGDTYWDHSSRIRKLSARIASLQTSVPLILWTERVAISINTTLIRKRLGVDGLVYLELPD